MRKLPNARKAQENLSILHYALGKHVSLLRFSRVFAHKPYQNATPMHSVIYMGLNSVFNWSTCIYTNDDIC